MEEEKSDCKGLVFRGYKSLFYVSAQEKFEMRQGIKLLKKKSCSGCEHCGWLIDNAKESIDWDGLIMPDIIHEALYTLKVTNESRDWESGIVDDWDIEVIMIEEKQ